MTTESVKTHIQQLDDLDWHSTMPNIFSQSTSQLISLEDLEKHYNSSFLVTLSSSFVTSSISTTPKTMIIQEQLHYWPMLLLIFPLITVFGNVLVVLSVIREANLHTATNYFIVSLAAADIGLALVVMPLASWVEANSGRWRYGNVLCDIFIMFDVMLCTASILNLAAISMDRYVAVTRPIFYAQHSKNIRVSLTIAFTWILSFVIALPIACGLNNVPHRILDVCIMYTPEYIIGSSIGSFYIPCPIMIILYYRVFRAIRQRTRRSKYKEVGKFIKPKSHLNSEQNSEIPCSTVVVHCDELANSTSTSHKTQKGPGMVLSNPNCDKSDQTPVYQNKTFDFKHSKGSNSYNNKELINSFPLKNQIVKSNPPKDNLPIDEDNQSLKEHQELATVEFQNMEDFRKHLRERIRRAKRSSLSILTPNFSRLSSKSVYGLTTVDSHGRTNSQNTSPFWHSIRVKCGATFRHRNRSMISSLRCPMHNNSSKYHSSKNIGHCSKRSNMAKTCIHNGSTNKINSKENLAARREKKATKTLAIVLGVFLFCWMPFFTVNIANAFCFKISSLKSTPVCNMPDSVTTVCVWLGYINSFLNPILYTIFNNDFRKAFKKLLYCN